VRRIRIECACGHATNIPYIGYPDPVPELWDKLERQAALSDLRCWKCKRPLLPAIRFARLDGQEAKE
jgi:hypothetical protein